MLAKIENAMVEFIKWTLTYLRSVETYGGELDDETFDIVRSFPAVWVTFAGSDKPKQLGADRFLAPATFATICGSRSLRGEKETRHGGPSEEVGVYQILNDLNQLFLMNDLKEFGLEIDHFRPGRVRTLYNTKQGRNGIAVFSHEWHTAYIVNKTGLQMIGGAPVAPVDVGGKTVMSPIIGGKPVEEQPGYLERIHADYQLKPGDDNPDASDDVILNT